MYYLNDTIYYLLLWIINYVHIICLRKKIYLSRIIIYIENNIIYREFCNFIKNFNERHIFHIFFRVVIRAFNTEIPSPFNVKLVQLTKPEFQDQTRINAVIQNRDQGIRSFDAAIALNSTVLGKLLCGAGSGRSRGRCGMQHAFQ